MTNPKCNQCSSKMASVVFFSIKVVPHTQTHIDSVHGGVRMRLCRDCAQTQFDPSLHVGILYKTAAIEYASLVNSIEDQSSIQDKFMDDGLVVIDPRTDTSARAAVTFLTDMLKLQLLNEAKSMDNLRHIFSSQPNHPGRTWRQLYPSLGGDRIKSRPWIDKLSILRVYLEKCIYTDIYFARAAHINMCQLQNRPIDKISLCEGFLQLWNVNALAKSDDLTEPQNGHIDGTGVNLIAIVIDSCGENGYNFQCVPGSHNLLQSHDNEKSLPLSLMKTYNVPKGMILVFAESLIHAGGASSMTSDEYIMKYEGHPPPPIRYFKTPLSYKYPTDMSFQLSFQHFLDDICSYSGYAKPIWYKNQIAINNGDKAHFRDYITKAKGRYKVRIDTMFNDYIDNIRGIEKNRKPSYRQCKRIKKS